MRKFKVNICYEVTMPVEIEALNETDAVEQARGIFLDYGAEGVTVKPSFRYVTDVEEKDEDFEEAVDELVSESLDYNHGRYSTEELVNAARELISFGSDYFEQYSKEDLVYQLFDEADHMREDLEKTMEKCRGENF